jgi:ferrous iron transport protein B
LNRTYTIGVVGNPNCGKTTLFNALTGARQRVGNWPGVTVERKVGGYRFEGADYQVVDLPGTYSLDVTGEGAALDERIARDFVHAGEADLLVAILDASNLERNLYLTAQLIEMRRPMLVALNMMDAAESAGLRIDVPGLARRLGCPVVPMVAARNRGIDELRQAIAQAVARPAEPSAEIPYAAGLEQAVRVLVDLLAERADAVGADPRWLAVRLLEGDDLARSLAGPTVDNEVLAGLRAALPDDIDILLADGRYGFANRITRETVRRGLQLAQSRSDRIDRVVLGRVLGIPIFLLVMYLMFMFTISIGTAFIDFFEIFVGTLVVDGFAALLNSLGSPQWLTVVLAQGAGGGVQVVASFIPIIALLYLFLSVLEDSGYMARAAFVTDRSMRALGLPGKSFVPLVVGFGCNVPAIMATRTLERRRDRMLTIAMIPFMSCGARLPVYALFAAAFFPVGGQNVVFALYLIGIAVAALTALVLKSSLLRGEPTAFVLELPAYRVPTLKGVLLHSGDRTLDFILGAGRIIVPMVLVINVLNAVGTDGSFGHQNTDRSVLSEVGRAIAPAFAPIGVDADNWPAAAGILTGVLAKEAVVGTLDSLYRGLAEADSAVAGLAPAEQDGFSILAGMSEAVRTIPVNLAEALRAWRDPLGIGLGDVHDIAGAAVEQGVAAGTFGAMAQRFDGAVGAFAYLLFILLYFPCAATLAAVQRETSARWALFVAAWTTGVGYVVATVFYQAATFVRDPVAAGAWIAGMLGLLLTLVLGLRRWGANAPDGEELPRPAARTADWQGGPRR